MAGQCRALLRHVEVAQVGLGRTAVSQGTCHKAHTSTRMAGVVLVAAALETISVVALVLTGSITPVQANSSRTEGVVDATDLQAIACHRCISTGCRSFGPSRLAGSQAKQWTSWGNTHACPPLGTSITKMPVLRPWKSAQVHMPKNLQNLSTMLRASASGANKLTGRLHEHKR